MSREKSAENSRVRLSHKDFLDIAGEILDRGKPFSFPALGASMSPFIKNGDIVTLLRDEKTGVGDVVLFQTGTGRLCLHRVVKRVRSGLITRGDASLEEDGFTPFENILGRVAKVSGKGYNFHLRHPVKELISKRIIFSHGFYRRPFLIKLVKRIANILG